MHLVSCARCGRIHPWGQCPVPKPRRNGSGERNGVQKFRDSARWKNKALEIKKRDKFLCRLCLEEGYINTHDLSVHHIIPIAKDESRRLEGSNLITLCRRHHDLVEGDEQYVAVLQRLTSIPPGKSLK